MTIHSMKKEFIPELNKIYVFDTYCLLFIGWGHGTFQVDFLNYQFGANKAIFLSPGQYFQLLAGSFTMTLYEFPNQNIQQLENSRILFKHLVSLGHIDLESPRHFHLNKLEYINFTSDVAKLLTTAIDDWIEFNPFGASWREVQLLFDIKDIIDKRYAEPISITELSKQVHEKSHHVERLTKEKLHQTIRQLSDKKLLLESQRKVVFTTQSTKEIAYELGFRDPTYFNRYFKLKTHKTPWEFRQHFEVDRADTFVKDLTLLLDSYYKSHRFAEYYANQLSVSLATFHRKVQSKMGVSFNQLLKEKLINEAVSLLTHQTPIRTTALELGFAEANHFSTFIKTHTGKTPTQWASGE